MKKLFNLKITSIILLSISLLLVAFQAIYYKTSIKNPSQFGFVENITISSFFVTYDVFIPERNKTIQIKTIKTITDKENTIVKNNLVHVYFNNSKHIIDAYGQYSEKRLELLKEKINS